MSRILQPLLRVRVTRHCLPSVGVKRSHSTSTNYSSFPASLLRYNARQKFGLYDRSELHEMGDKPYWDGVELSENGLIVPGASKDPAIYRGAMLMPNTFTMQEIIRTEIDHYFDNEELGKEVETPFVYSIQKGTPLPSSIVLFREGLSRFSLQPSKPMSIENLNTLLDEYFEKYAEKNTAERWLDENDFNSAVGDDAVTIWMAR